MASLAIAACGPSLRRVHRASGYFEGCYAADLDPAVPDTERRACWQAWKRDYRIGADPERLDYVRERLAMLDPDRAAAIALATGDDGSIVPMDEAPHETETVPAETVPAETTSTSGSTSTSTSASDPPRVPTPSEAAPRDPADAAAAAEARRARAHERHVHRGILAPTRTTTSCPCDDAWRTCAAACLADDHGCVGACRHAHTLCSRSCY